MEAAAVKVLEDYLSLKFITQTWDIYFDHYPRTYTKKWWDGVRDTAFTEIYTQDRNIKLPIGRCQSLEEFSTYSDSQEFVEDVSNYVFDNISQQAKVGLKIGGIWPTTVLRANNAIRFRVVVGFGAQEDVPKDIVQAIKEFVAHMYENRGDQNEMTIPPHILYLVEHYRRVKIGC